jgi:hypothetical protein
MPAPGQCQRLPPLGQPHWVPAKLHKSATGRRTKTPVSESKRIARRPDAGAGPRCPARLCGTATPQTHPLSMRIIGLATHLS